MKQLWLALILISGCVASIDAVTADKLIHYFPGILCPPQVELALPQDNDVKVVEDFHIIWGRQQELASIPNDNFRQALPKVLKEPVFWVRLSMNEAQTGPHSFSSSTKESIGLLKQMGMRNIREQWHQWGPYPIRTLTAESKNHFFAMAHVGLNYHGNTLIISLACPEKMSAESIQKAKRQWNVLMTETQFSTWPNEEERERFLEQVL